MPNLLQIDLKDWRQFVYERQWRRIPNHGCSSQKRNCWEFEVLKQYLKDLPNPRPDSQKYWSGDVQLREQNSADVQLRTHPREMRSYCTAAVLRRISLCVCGIVCMPTTDVVSLPHAANQHSYSYSFIRISIVALLVIFG